MRRMMVGLVYTRKKWRVVKENAMQDIFDECPARQPEEIHSCPDDDFRGGRFPKRKQSSEEDWRGKNQKLGKISDLSHFHCAICAHLGELRCQHSIKGFFIFA